MIAQMTGTPTGGLRERLADALRAETYPYGRGDVRGDVLDVADAVLPVVEDETGTLTYLLRKTEDELHEQRQRAEEAERQRDEARIAVSEATEALLHASTEITEAKARLAASAAACAEHAIAITDLSAERDEALAAVARVRRLCDLTIATSIRIQAIAQAEDTLRLLDQPKGSAS